MRSRKTSLHAIRCVVFVGVFSMAGCGRQDFVHDEVLVEPYRLVAVDISADTSLCRSVGENCDGSGLPGPTIFQAGVNAQYIVLGRHPLKGFKPDRTVTEFYVIVLSAKDWHPGDERNPKFGAALVKGPLNEVEYQREKSRLQLPEFSRVFGDLK